MFHDAQVLRLSHVHVRDVESQRVLCNQLVTRFAHSGGMLTLFNAPAPGQSDDLTVTRLGQRWWDAGLYVIERNVAK